MTLDVSEYLPVDSPELLQEQDLSLVKDRLADPLVQRFLRVKYHRTLQAYLQCELSPDNEENRKFYLGGLTLLTEFINMSRK